MINLWIYIKVSQDNHVTEQTYLKREHEGRFVNMRKL